MSGGTNQEARNVDEPQTEHTIVRIVVIALSLVTLAGLGIMAWLIYVGTEASSIALISSPTTTALGALSAMLVSTRSTKQSGGS